MKHGVCGWPCSARSGLRGSQIVDLIVCDDQ
jgi:hypothetical protein